MQLNKMAAMVLQYIMMRKFFINRYGIILFVILSIFVDLKGAEIDENELALHHFMQGEFLMNQGNYALAVLEFQDAIDLDPNAATIHVSIADAYRKLGKIKRSENHLKIAIELDPDEIEAQEMLAEIFIKKKDYNAAKMVFEKLYEIDANNLDYIFALADLARIQKDWELAINYYIEAYNTNSIAINGLEQALQIAIATNDFLKAEEICNFFLKEDSNNSKILLTLKDLSLFNENYEAAIEAINKLEKINGKSTELSIQKSAIYEELQDQKQAMDVLLDSFKNDSNNIDILNSLVNLFIDQKNNEQAAIYNEKIISLFPDDPRGYINTAIIAMSNKNPDKAILSLSQHSDKFSSNFTIQYLLGTAFYQIKDYTSAKIYLLNALRIFPQSKNARHNLALIYDTISEWEKSDNIYMELINDDSTDAQAYNNYAYSLVERGINITFALELAKNAVRLEPKSAAYLDTLGWIYYKMSSHEKALKYIRESLSLDPENATIREHFDQIIKDKAETNIPKLHQVEN